MKLGIFSIFVAYKFVECLDPYITGGSRVEYSKYPHSAFILNFCEARFSCGGSVINQHLILTAAHCLEDCLGIEQHRLFVKYGHHKLKHQHQTKAKYFTIHEDYNEFTLTNDIGMLMTKDMIPLDHIVKRVLIMRDPPNVTKAFVAGWGIDEDMEPQWSLKHVEAQIRDEEVCSRMGWLPKGAFCAGPIHGVGAADRGDSGSALIINEYIQIGIVSFKTLHLSLVAYTNVTYFLDWIEDTAEDLFCLEATSRENQQNSSKKELIRCDARS